MHPTPLGNLQFFYLEYLTLLMCFGIADYNHMPVAKVRCGKILRVLWLQHHILGFPHLCLTSTSGHRSVFKS